MKNQNQEEEFGIGLIDLSQYQEDFEEKPKNEEKEEIEDEFIEEEVEQEEEESQEEEVEEITEPVVEEQTERPVEEEEQEETPVEVTPYSNIAKKYIENGYWEDYLIEVDGEEIPISEAKDIDEDLFLSIQEAQKKNEDEKYIRKEDLDDVSKDLFEILKGGGDVTQLLQIKKEIVDPLQSYDLDNELHQETLVRHMYAVENGISDPKKIDALVKAHKENLDLDTTAKGFADRLHKYYENSAKQEKERVKKIEEERKQREAKLKKDLEKSLKKMVKNTSALKPLIDAATNVEKELGTYRVNTDFLALRDNPDEFAEYLIWRYNRDEYNKIVNKEESKDTARKNLTRLNLARQTKSKASNRVSKKSKVDEFMTESMDI